MNIGSEVATSTSQTGTRRERRGGTGGGATAGPVWDGCGAVDLGEGHGEDSCKKALNDY